jgi:hypothetical protein
MRTAAYNRVRSKETLSILLQQRGEANQGRESCSLAVRFTLIAMHRAPLPPIWILALGWALATVSIVF